jgi:HEPN domain-containing protein
MAQSIPEQWAQQARYDLETARAMLESGRYLYVLFCCQQGVEKLIKGVIAERTGEMPPRLHNLVTLANQAALEVDPDRAALMRDLVRYYIETRYPDQIAALGLGVTRQKAQEVLRQTEALVQWLSSMLP